MPARKRPLRRGEIIGEVVTPELGGEADCYLCCPTCGGLIDIPDLAQVLEHAGPLPHPVDDRTQ